VLRRADRTEKLQEQSSQTRLGGGPSTEAGSPQRRCGRRASTRFGFPYPLMAGWYHRRVPNLWEACRTELLRDLAAHPPARFWGTILELQRLLESCQSETGFENLSTWRRLSGVACD
jgi:hypothetical protein